MFGPKKPSVSYSGPLRLRPSTGTRRSQRMGQLTQPLLRMSCVSVSVSPETASARSKWPRWKFFVGRAFVALALFTRPAEP